MTKTPQAGLRERKKQQTRVRIQQAAVQLTATKGLDAVTVDDIAEAAEVSARTFFNYFASKDAAIIGVDVQDWAEYAQAINDAPAGLGALDCLEHVVVEVMIPEALHGMKAQRMKVVLDNPRLVPLVFEAWRQMAESGTAALARRLGLAPDHPFPGLVVNVAMAVVRSSLATSRQQGRPPADCIREGFAAVRAGLNRMPGEALKPT